MFNLKAAHWLSERINTNTSTLLALLAKKNQGLISNLVEQLNVYMSFFFTPLQNIRD